MALNVQTMLALARLFLACGDLDAAMFQLTALLRVDKNNVDATMVRIAFFTFNPNYIGVTGFSFSSLLVPLTILHLSTWPQ